MSQDRTTILTAKIDSTDAEAGTITGIAATYNVPVPRGGHLYEMLAPGVFRNQVGAANRVSVLWQHDWDSPIGRAVDLADSDQHLRFTAKITEHQDVPEARKALALLREGIIDEVSVGFDWGTWTEQRDEDDVTILHTKARLREFSIVTFGALGRDARVVSVASDKQVQQAAAWRARLMRLNS
jgi:HK97 family phage prohead protease